MRANNHTDRKSRRSRRNQRGNTMLELVFFLMPTMAIVCGFMDIGMVLFVWNTIQNAVREGTRYAITYQVDATGTQTASIKDTVASWTMNLVQASSTASTSGHPPYITVDFYTPPTTVNPSGTLVTGTAGANAPGNIVQVSINNYPFAWMAPFNGLWLNWSSTNQSGFYEGNSGGHFTPLSITVVSADVLGGQPAAGLPPATP